MNRTSTSTCTLRVLPLLSLLVASAAFAQTATTDSGTIDSAIADALHDKRPYSPYADRSFPTRPLFGDTHMHTSFSMDAGAFGARLGPSEAYQFARGEQVMASSGQPVKLSRPLDFLVVADHSDNMGFFPDLFAGKPELLSDPTGRKWYDMIQSGNGGQAALEIIVAFSHNNFPPDLMYFPGTKAYGNAWQKTIDAAENYNDPGTFTAFIGFEWTSNTGGNNLHRNVIFRDNGDKASQVVPFTVYPPHGSDNPADLWQWMSTYEEKTGGSVLAIAHNGNLSSGLMFPVVEAFGKRLNREYVETRAKWERLYEATQTKGDGEAHPFLSPNDEFADFHRWDKGNLDGSVAKTNDMLEFEYARSALKNGLKLEDRFGTNPYKFGMIGSTDAHTGLMAIEDLRAPTSCAATSIASTMLWALATPLPAMSNAVPWSTEVRTIGRPRVTLTPESALIWPLLGSMTKPSVLTTMWPWSWYMAITASNRPASAFTYTVSPGTGPVMSMPSAR
jgi:hypothetical protein